jgi:tetratricopeptide (TPR) repeat protein
MANSARIDELRQKFDENPRRYFAPLANEYRKAGDLDQAISICQEYLPQQPGHMSGHIVYGQALYESDRLDDARAVFETALSLDPENLIALRHLGDIARQGDDVATAREWYRRALEVDPRNEEISALVDSLPGAAATAPAAVQTEAEPSVEPPAIPVSFETPGAVGAEYPDLEVERSQEAVSAESVASWQEHAQANEDDELEPVPPPAAPAPPDATADDLLDLDDFSLGDLTFGATAAASSATRPESSGDADMGLTLEQETALFDSDSFDESAPPPFPDIELATDINLGLIDDGMAQTTSTPPTSSLSGLETFEAGTLPQLAAEAPTLDVGSFFELPEAPESTEKITSAADVPMSDEETIPEPRAEELLTNNSAPIDGGHDGQDVPAERAEAAAPAAVFVTETMAELYIQQGHLESALEIYRKLVEQRPNEPELADRLRAIEDRLFAAPRARETETTRVAVAASAHGEPTQAGPTIREFLTALISQRAVPGGSAGSSNGSSQSVSEPSDGVSQSPRSLRATPNSEDTVSGSIDALFSGAIATASDSMAAITLSDAFAPSTDASENKPLEGAPAHRADDELSLDHVFRANAALPPSSGRDDFSFDEFFAEEPSEGSATGSGDASSGSGAPDDIAQFNAWLNGLKKT